MENHIPTALILQMYQGSRRCTEVILLCWCCDATAIAVVRHTRRVACRWMLALDPQDIVLGNYIFQPKP